MHEIVCPHCGKAFKIDEAGYADILKQVRDSDFSASCFSSSARVRSLFSPSRSLSTTLTASVIASFCTTPIGRCMRRVNLACPGIWICCHRLMRGGSNAVKKFATSHRPPRAVLQAVNGNTSKTIYLD